LQQKGGECHAESTAEATAAGPQDQGPAQAEGAQHLSASQQLSLNSDNLQG